MTDLFERIKQDVAIISFVEMDTGSRAVKVGSSRRINPCPLCGHNDCFTLYTDNSWRCFSPTCDTGKNGSVIDYVMRRRGLSKPLDAAHYIAERAGIRVEERGARKPEAKSGSTEPKPPPQGAGTQAKEDPPLIAPKRAAEVRRMAADFYHAELLNAPVALAFQQATRGHSMEILVAHKVGYASERSIIHHATRHGYTVEDLEAVGLAKRDDKHGVRPVIPQGAYVYPHTKGGHVLYFTLKHDKFRFQVKKEFAAAGWLCLNQEAMSSKRFMLVEGENDLLTVADKGNWPHVAAVIGNFNTSNLLDHLSMEKVSAGRMVYLCFDNDAAGRKYTTQYTEAIRRGGGLVRVLTLPEGTKDIDLYLRQVQAPDAALRDLLAAAHDPPAQPRDELPQHVPADAQEPPHPADVPPPPSGSNPFAFKNFSVLGEMEDGKLVFQANDIQKIHIVSLRDLTMEKMVQIGGIEVKKRVARSDKDMEPGQVHLYALRKHMVLEARRNQLGSLHWIGQGVHAISAERLLIVNGSEAYTWNGRELEPYTDAMIENKIISRRSSARWIDAEALSKALAELTPDSSRAAIAELQALVSQWGFEGSYDVHIVTGYILAQIVQSIWAWRPQLWITGKHGSGKTILLDIMQEIGGDLARHFEGSSTTEPGFRQGLRNDFLLAAIDEFEKSEDRDKIISYLRTAGRGGFVVKGSPGQEVVEYYIKHMVVVASIETGLVRAAEKTRFLIVELNKDERHNPQKPTLHEIDALRVRLFAVAISQGLAARRLITRMPRIKGADPRLAEAYAVPFAMLSMNEPDPLDHLHISVGLAMEDHERRQDETPEDEDNILDAILNSGLRVNIVTEDDKSVYAERTVLWLLRSQNPIHRDDAAAAGVWCLMDNSIFFATDIIRRKLLRDTPWAAYNITGILKRVPGMTKERTKRQGKLFKGLKWTGHNLIGDNGGDPLNED